MLELLRLIPYIWPTIRELIVGGKNHPYFQGKNKVQPNKVIVLIAIIVTIVFGDIAYILYKENTLLTEQVRALQNKPLHPTLTLDDYANWKVCSASLGFEKTQAIKVHDELETQRAEIKLLNSQIDHLKELLLLCRETKVRTQLDSKEQKRKELNKLLQDLEIEDIP